MVQDAQGHADEDKERREEIEARNRLDALIYSTEKTVQENKDKLSSSDVEAAEKAIEAARKVMDGEGKDRIEEAAQELTRASHRMAEELYKSATASPGAAPDQGSPSPGRGQGGRRRGRCRGSGQVTGRGRGRPL